MTFQQGLSGLNASSKNLEVIGNNIANASTYGFKASRAEFADVYANALNGTGTNAVGIGVNIAAVSQQFLQGNITGTDNPMDLAINGPGFFQVTDGVSPAQYTRNGQFKVDRFGQIVTNDGLKLMGFQANASGVIIGGQARPITLPTAGIEPNMTTEMQIEANMDSRVASTVPVGTPMIDFGDATTFNKTTSQTVFDAKGQDVAVTYYFQKSADDTWNVYATANGTSIAVDGAGDPQPITTITFSADGKGPTAPTAPVSIDIPASTNAAGATTMAINGVQLDVSKMTQYGTAFGFTDVRQDGYAAGELSGVTVEDNGIITARYSNGQTKSAGQVQIANFRNPQGLQPVGGNNWEATYASGDPIVGSPGDGSFGVLQAGALEESKTDLTGELVNMITAQRVYQANAQTIKTQDQVLQTLVNLR